MQSRNHLMIDLFEKLAHTVAVLYTFGREFDGMRDKRVPVKIIGE